MRKRHLKLTVLEGLYAISRLAPEEPLPAWTLQGAVRSITRTPDELSIICAESAVPAGVKADKGWRYIKVQGPLDLNQIGILGSLAVPLATARISLFALSTFETDYVLVREADLAKALEVLKAGGHTIQDPPGGASADAAT
jgi:hypothetical protein